MTKKLVFTVGREAFTIEIYGKDVWMRDRKNKVKRLLPPKKGKEEVVFDSPEDAKRYENVKTEEELTKIVIEDCKKKGAVLRREE